MTEYPQFAYTGATPEKGCVGFVNIQRTDENVRFTVRSEGENPPYATYEVPFAEALKLLNGTVESLLGPGRAVPPHGSGP